MKIVVPFKLSNWWNRVPSYGEPSNATPPDTEEAAEFGWGGGGGRVV